MIDADKVRAETGWGAVADIPDFPFGSFEELLRSLSANKHAFGVDRTAALHLENLTTPVPARLFNMLLMWTPYLVGLVAVGAAFTTGRYGLLLGLPVAIIASVLANPYNPFRGLMTVAGLAAPVLFGISLFTGHGTIALLFATFFVPFHATRAVRARTTLALEAVVLESEPLFLYLYAKRACFLRDNQSGVIMSHSG